MDRAREGWIANWLDTNPYKSSEEAAVVWDGLTPETKATLMNLEESAHRANLRVKRKLLEFLETLQEGNSVKEPFRLLISSFQEGYDQCRSNPY
jgi:hypothetical protein